METQKHSNVYTVNEFLEIYKIGRTKFYQEVDSGRLKIRKLGRKTLVLAKDAEAWLNALPEAA